MTDFISPPGRLLQGEVLGAQTKDNKGQQLTVKTGPNKGAPTQRAFIAVGFPKTQAAWWQEQAPPHANGQPNTFWQDIYNTARSGYPQHFNPDGSCKHPRMAFKVMDGDGVDDNGTPNNTKEGFAGHWVVKFSSSFIPQAIMNGATLNPNDPVQKDAIKRGYWVRVLGNMAPNIGSEVPGVYINHNGVEFIAYAEEIKSGPSAAAAFAANAYTGPLPPGATLAPPTPTATPSMPGAAVPGIPGVPAMPSSMPAPQMPAMPAPAGVPMPGAPAAMPAMPAPAGVQPNHAFVQGAIGVPPGVPAPPAMPAMPAAPQVPQYQMIGGAASFTREQMHANGWTDDALIAGGMMRKNF